MISKTTYLSVNLNILVDLMRVRAESVLQKKFAIDYSQFLVLHIINILDSPYQSDIAQKIGITTAGVSKIIDKLVESELVTKIMDQKNRRANHLALTAIGQKTISKALVLLENEFDTLISPEDKIVMSSLTNKTILKLI